MEIRHAEPADYGRVIARVNTWWGGREMAPMLPRLFFVHFEGTSYVVDDEDGQLAAFLIGFLSQTDPEEAYVHFVGIAPERRGEGLGRRLYERFFADAAAHGRTRRPLRHVSGERELGRIPPRPRLRGRARCHRLRRPGRGSRALPEAVAVASGTFQAMDSGPFLSTASRPRRRARPLALLLVVAALVAAAAAAFGVIALLERDTIPHGTTIGGVDVGGMDEAQARVVLEQEAESRLAQPVRLRGPDGSLTTSGREVGAEARVDEALEVALDAGSLDRVLARIGVREGPDVTLGFRPAPVRTARLANRIDRRFGTPSRDAGVVVSDDAIRIVPRGTGWLSIGALRRALRTLPPEIELSVTAASPVGLDRRGARRGCPYRAPARRAASRPVRRRESTLTPTRLRTSGANDAGERCPWRIARSDGPRRLAARAARRLTRCPSRRNVRGQRRTRAGRPLKARTPLDLERISRSLMSNLASTVHRARFVVSQPPFTTEDAESLRIEELVSEFTTYYPCCAPRVTNIQRGAQIMDGTIVRPGERFSLNDVLGRRTPERGFVEAPQILRGRLEDAVGGGVSQIATTTYNAAFFAGVQIVEHQPHEFYISRYPMGREATVSWGGPELIWRNDWPAAILVKAFADSASITVRLYSSKLGRRVETTTGEPSEYTSPTTITVSNSSLQPGTTRAVQSAGPQGFPIPYTRKVFRGPKLKRSELYAGATSPRTRSSRWGRRVPRRKPKPPVSEAAAPVSARRRPGAARRGGAAVGRSSPSRRRVAHRSSSISASEASWSTWRVVCVDAEPRRQHALDVAPARVAVLAAPDEHVRRPARRSRM